MHFNSLNLIIILLFLLINPLFSLAIATLISVITGRVNNSIIALLFILSFGLLFSNQVFYVETDLGQYIEMYQTTQSQTISKIFHNFLVNPNGTEFLWLWSNKLIGAIFNYNPIAFVIFAYLLIFSLIAYYAYLNTESNRHNYLLMLFCSIFFTMNIWEVGYNVFRNFIAAIIFLIGLSHYFSTKSKLFSRLIIYCSIFFHLSVVPVVAIFEIYVLALYKKNMNSISLTPGNIFKIVLFTSTLILSLHYINKEILNILNITQHHPLSSAINKYKGYEPNDFNVISYIRPIYFMFIGYIIYSWKNIGHNELFILIVFIILTVMSTNHNDFVAVYSRAILVSAIAIPFLSIKILRDLPQIFLLFFILIIFSIRMSILPNSANSFFIDELALGEVFNPIFGLIVSIYYFEPLFEGFRWYKY